MKPVIDATHDAERRSWVESANAADCDFPIQNLPFGRFRPQPPTAGASAWPSATRCWTCSAPA